MQYIDFSALPPGFGFHPTDVELVKHYLKRKIMGFEDGVIPEVDIYKHEPWDLPAKSGIPSREGKWHFFNMRDRKYPNGSRSNRATQKGYWKSTGKDRTIRLKNHSIGTKKTLVFHEGRPPTGTRTNWIMHEFYLDEKECKETGVSKDLFVLCRVTKRNNFEEAHCPEEAPNTLSTLPQERKLPKLKNQKVEPQNSSEHECYEDWVNELYWDLDPPLQAAIPVNVVEKSDSESSCVHPILALESAPVSKEGRLLDFQDPNCNAWPEVYASEFPSNDIFDPLDSNFSQILTNSLQFSECLPAKGDLNVNMNCISEVPSDTGIIIRPRLPRASVEGPRHRIKLQLHKTETGKTGVLNQTVLLNRSNHRLIDSNGDCSVIKEEVVSSSMGKTVINEMDAGEDSSVKVEEEAQFPSCNKKDSSNWNVVKRSLQGVLEEARSLVRSCSCLGSNHLLMGTCLVGAAAVVAYLNQEDDQCIH